MKPPVTSPSVRDEDEEKLVSDRIASSEAGVAALRTQRAEVGCSRTAETMLAAAAVTAAVTMTVTVTMVTTMVRTTLLCGSHHPENEAEGPPVWAYHTTSSFSVSGSRVRGKCQLRRSVPWDGAAPVQRSRSGFAGARRRSTESCIRSPRLTRVSCAHSGRQDGVSS